MGRTTKFSANESALAIEMLAKNGLNAQQIAGGALRSAMMVAAASGSDLAGAADLVTDVMLNFGKQAGDLGAVADGISGVLLQSKFGIDDYRLALAQAGGVAGGLGVTLQDFNTAIAATSASFASGSDAGTSFKTFLARLVPASKPAAKAMKRLNLEFFDSKGNMKDMGEIAQELQEGVKGLSDEARNEYLQDIFGTDAIRTAIALSKQGVAGFEAIERAIAKASATEQAEARMKGFWGEWEKLSSALEGLSLTAGDMGLPGLTDGLVIARNLVDQINAALGQAGLSVNLDEMNAAKAAVSDLIAMVGELMNMGGGDESAIVRFFNRLSEMSNNVSRAINIGRDALQAVGLVEQDDDTPEVRKKRRDDLFDGIERIDGGRVGAGINDAYRWATRTPEETANQNDDARRQWIEDYERSNAAYDQPVEVVRPRERTNRVEGAQRPQPSIPARFGTDPIPAATGNLQASMDALTAAMGDLARRRSDAVASSTSTSPVENPPQPTPRPITITPTARPDIVGPVKAEGEAAAIEAEAIGSRITNAFSVTAAPTVDASSIRAAGRDADALIRKLQSIPGLAERANAATASVRSPRIDFGGLHHGD